LAKDEYGLTTNQRAFADKYIELKGNGTQAYLFAYPNVKKETTARANASRLLTNANVKDYISERTKEVLVKQKMTGDEIIIQLTSFARREQQTSYNKHYDHLKDKVVKEMTYTFQPSVEEAENALETLVKWAGLDNPNNDLYREKLKAEIEKIYADIQEDDTQENKLSEYFDLLGDAIDDE
jgi:phage terminase small subunit